MVVFDILLFADNQAIEHTASLITDAVAYFVPWAKHTVDER